MSLKRLNLNRVEPKKMVKRNESRECRIEGWQDSDAHDHGHREGWQADEHVAVYEKQNPCRVGHAEGCPHLSKSG